MKMTTAFKYQKQTCFSYEYFKIPFKNTTYNKANFNDKSEVYFHFPHLVISAAKAFETLTAYP